MSLSGSYLLVILYGPQPWARHLNEVLSTITTDGVAQLTVAKLRYYTRISKNKNVAASNTLPSLLHYGIFYCSHKYNKIGC